MFGVTIIGGGGYVWRDHYWKGGYVWCDHYWRGWVCLVCPLLEGVGMFGVTIIGRGVCLV